MGEANPNAGAAACQLARERNGFTGPPQTGEADLTPRQRQRILDRVTGKHIEHYSSESMRAIQ